LIRARPLILLAAFTNGAQSSVMTFKLLPEAGTETHPHDQYRLAVLVYQAAWRRGEPDAQLDRLRNAMEAAHAVWRTTTGWV
jgi:hypothetical protein